MIYVISDIHGYPFYKVMSLLQQAAFDETDFLFVLGDVLIEVRMESRCFNGFIMHPNVELLMDNLEAMFLSCDFIFDEITDVFLTGLIAPKNVFIKYMAV